MSFSGKFPLWAQQTYEGSRGNTQFALLCLLSANLKIIFPSVTEVEGWAPPAETSWRITASLRSALGRDGHSGAVADGFVVLGPHELGRLTDLTGLQRQEDVSGLLVHAGHNLLSACE